MLWKDFVLLLHREAADRTGEAMRDRLASNPSGINDISAEQFSHLEPLDARVRREEDRYKLWLERAKELYL
ncbi:MAG: hypothetical protein KJ587_03805 [Alphaproteobacteria bacterium]|nr:hypothetical protein [Alphaproteobacteria bacterium]